MTNLEMFRVAAARPQGTSTTDRGGLDPMAWRTARSKLVERREVYGTVSAAPRAGVYFSTASARDEYLRQHATERGRKTTIKDEVQRLRPDAPVVVPPGVAVQVCPGWTPRWRSVDLPFVMPVQRGRC